MIYKNLIVGGGLSGAVLANLIATYLNEKVIVIDRRSVLGGNIFDYQDNETHITVQRYGPHIFHTNNKEVWDYLSQFTKWNWFFFKPKAVIEGNVTTIPFNLTSLYECFSPYLASKIEKKLISNYGYGGKIPILKLKENNDKDLKFVADYIYENMFKNYTIKQWGNEDIDSTVMARVPIYISHDNRYFQDKYQGILLNGYTKMVENILNHPNIEVRLNTDFKDIEENFDRIFYSGAIDEYFDYKFGELPYRSLEFDILKLNKEYYQKSAMINYPNNYDFTRITEHKYFLDEKSDKTIISIEYPKEFKRNKNERYYPINNLQTEKLYGKYKEEADKIKGLYFIGRLGEYKYINMDRAIEKIFEFFNKRIKN